MDKQFENYRLISVNQLVRAIREGQNNSERFCFIIGAGASVSSEIPTGITLESDWMKQMEENPGLAEIRETAKKLKKDHILEHDFEEIEKAWEEKKNSGTDLPSEFYFDIYKLRFFPNHRNGYHYLEKIMANKNPGFGYHPLALMLADGTGNNLVITTNFDSLIEDALFLYTDSKPLVINHELLADYAGDSNIKRPIIAKIHRGIFFDPLNQPEETNELKGKWHDVLVSIFQNYTPIVIGYGGGDNSLMNLLEEDSVRMKNGMYWCYVEKYGLPGEKIQNLVQEKKGYLVRTAGFDATMLAIGNALFPDKIGVHETEEYLNNRTSKQIENYEKEYKKLTENEKECEDGKEDSQSENEFKEEIEKITKRETDSVSEREKRNQLTAWDYNRQGYQYYKAEQYKEAIESFTNAIKKQGSVAQFYFNRGAVFNKLDDYEQALTDYNKAIKLKPEYVEAYNNRGNTYDGMGEKEKALSDYNKAIEQNPEDAKAYYNRGNIYLDMGEKEQALSDYSRAIELNPEYAEAYINRGIIYLGMGEKEKSLADYNKAIELNSEGAEAYINRGITYDDMGENEKALTDYNKAIELNPEYAKAYYNRGNTYGGMGEKGKALTDYNKAIELNPEYADAYNNRGNIYSDMGEKEKALSDYNKAIGLNSENAEAYNNRGNMYLDMGKNEQALFDYNRAIKLNPKYKLAYGNRAELYRLMGEDKKAKADEKKAAEL